MSMLLSQNLVIVFAAYVLSENKQYVFGDFVSYASEKQAPSIPERSIYLVITVPKMPCWAISYVLIT